MCQFCVPQNIKIFLKTKLGKGAEPVNKQISAPKFLPEPHARSGICCPAPGEYPRTCHARQHEAPWWVLGSHFWAHVLLSTHFLACVHLPEPKNVKILHFSKALMPASTSPVAALPSSSPVGACQDVFPDLHHSYHSDKLWLFFKKYNSACGFFLLITRDSKFLCQ